MLCLRLKRIIRKEHDKARCYISTTTNSINGNDWKLHGLAKNRKIFQLEVTLPERWHSRYTRQLTFFRLRITTNRYSEVCSTKYRPISNMDHFCSRNIKIENTFQPTACQGCTRKAFTIMSAEEHDQWNIAFSATRMKTSTVDGQHTKHHKIKPCLPYL